MWGPQGASSSAHLTRAPSNLHWLPLTRGEVPACWLASASSSLSSLQHTLLLAISCLKAFVSALKASLGWLKN